MLAEVLQRKHPEFIVRYHEHDLLLENITEEEMDEEEKKLAWKIYEEEKENANRPYREFVISENYEFFRNITTSCYITVF